MIDKLVEEINFALDNNLFLVALNTALTLPDICGKAEYPESKTTDRYKKWYQEYIGQYEQSPEDKEKDTGFPYLSDDAVYQLRCSLLHQGNPNVEKEKTDIDKFVLYLEIKNNFNIYADSASVGIGFGDKEKKYYRLSVRRLCYILCQCASKYYEQNKQKFNFFNYEIVREEDIERYLCAFDTFYKE